MWHEFDPLLRRGHVVASCLRLLVPRLAAAAPVALGDANGRDAARTMATAASPASSLSLPVLVVLG